MHLRVFWSQELALRAFPGVLARHPTPGRSFLDACVLGTMDLLDQFAEHGDGVSRLLVDAAEKGQSEVVNTMLLACADLNYSTQAGTPLRAAARNGHAAIVRSLPATQYRARRLAVSTRRR